MVKRVLSVTFDEVPLDPAPLVLVLCQLRFNPQPDLAQRAAIERIRDLLDGEYADIEERTDAGVTIDVGPPGVQMVQQASKSHVLRSPQHPWWILVGDGVATLATSEYSSRRDFVSRVCRLCEALEGVGVPAVHWVGVRYVSRVTGADFINDLPTYLQREMLGGTQLPLAPDVGLAQSVWDVAIPWEDHNVVRIRTGIVGPGVVTDPAIQPVSEQSWLLDIDAFNQKYRAIDQADEIAEGLAENQYQLFRSIVTDEFLIRFGGQP